MKQYKQLVLLLAMLLSGFASRALAQTVELHTLITLKDGQQQEYYLTEDDRISFEGQEKLVINTQGSAIQVAIDDIQRIEFVDTLGETEIEASSPFFYPNPVKNTLVLGNVEGQQLIRVYTAEGRLVKLLNAKANEKVDVSNLTAGMYILNINGKNFKLLKL